MAKVLNIVLKASGVLLILLGIVGIVGQWSNSVVGGLCMISLGWFGIIADVTESKGGE